MANILDHALVEQARLIVAEPETKFGYSDVGDTLVRYLQGKYTYAGAAHVLEGIAEDYKKARKS